MLRRQGVDSRFVYRDMINMISQAERRYCQATGAVLLNVPRQQTKFLPRNSIRTTLLCDLAEWKIQPQGRIQQIERNNFDTTMNKGKRLPVLFFAHGRNLFGCFCRRVRRIGASGKKIQYLEFDGSRAPKGKRQAKRETGVIAMRRKDCDLFHSPRAVKLPKRAGPERKGPLQPQLPPS